MSSKSLFSILIISSRDYVAIWPIQIQECKSNDFPESVVSICVFDSLPDVNLADFFNFWDWRCHKVPVFDSFDYSQR
jgi:hypothetical protein